MKLKAEFNFNRLCVYVTSTLSLHQLHGRELQVYSEEKSALWSHLCDKSDKRN